MKRKKLFSMLTAGVLAVTMVLPVAAADGGTVEVDVTTKTAVIRVEVPTSLAVAVNQFEKGDTGSQIFSGSFDIKNKSEIPVKVSVTSTVTLDNANPISLVSSKEAAEDSTVETGEAWLAIVAKTSATKYTEESDKDIKDLTEADENVATFVQGTESDADKATASQTFYLAAASSPTVSYVKLDVTDADKLATAKKTSYAQIYELTAMTSQPSTDNGVQAAVDAGDVYQIASDGTVTLLEKGTENVTFSTGATYYDVATSTAAKDMTIGKVYVYGEAPDGGEAGFRYIGKLSGAKETWSSTDISKVVIKYDIAGVTGTRYAEVEDDCTYGLYTPTVEPTNANVTKSNGTLWISVDGKAGFSAKPTSVKLNGTEVTNYKYESSGWMSMPASDVGDEILIVVGDTTYKVVVP